MLETLGLASKSLGCSFHYEFEGNESPPEFDGNLDHNSFILAKQMRKRVEGSRLLCNRISLLEQEDLENIRKIMEERRAKEGEEKMRLMQRRLS